MRSMAIGFRLQNARTLWGKEFGVVKDTRCWPTRRGKTDDRRKFAQVQDALGLAYSSRLHLWAAFL